MSPLARGEDAYRNGRDKMYLGDYHSAIKLFEESMSDASSGPSSASARDVAELLSKPRHRKLRCTRY